MLTKLIVKKYIEIQKQKLRQLEFPSSVMFFLTSRCNARCPHCFYWKDTNSVDELSDSQIVKIIDSLPKLGSIGLTGGEPMLRSNIIDIVKKSLLKSRLVTIITNGILTDKIREVAKEFYLSRTKLNFQVSIDGIRETHDKIRGSGSYDNTLDTIKLLRGNRYHVIAVITLSKLNYKEVEDVFGNLQGIVSEIRVNVLRSSHSSVWGLPTGKLNLEHTPRQEKIALSYNELRDTYSRLVEINKKYPLWTSHNQMLFYSTLKICLLYTSPSPRD